MSSEAVGSGLGSVAGTDATGSSSGMADGTEFVRFTSDEGNGDVFVGPLLIYVNSSGTEDGLTFSTIVKDGNRSTVVGSA